jgi:hypothetical protein
MIFQRGSSGPEVQRIQQRLQELKLYLGPIDSLYGGATESAVKTFQKAEKLSPDGVVGPQTWARLFPQETAAALDLLEKPVAQRCLALTGSFETGAGLPECFAGLSGDFDGQGLSLGALQWNLGQGSLQPMIQQMLDRHRSVLEQIFHEHFGEFLAAMLSPLADQLAWARSIQDLRRFQVLEPWRGLLKALCRSPEFQAIQVRHAGRLLDRAIELCGEFSLTTERAAALMFDILVQNGSISFLVKAQIQQDLAQLGPLDDPLAAEVAHMRVIANRRAAACRPEYIADVRSRKLTIAEGKGLVHNLPYDLELQYGLRLKPFQV